MEVCCNPDQGNPTIQALCQECHVVHMKGSWDCTIGSMSGISHIAVEKAGAYILFHHISPGDSKPMCWAMIALLGLEAVQS